ncbi:hypothetical protein AgCh_009508 [Apium graveolens]
MWRKEGTSEMKRQKTARGRDIQKRVWRAARFNKRDAVAYTEALNQIHRRSLKTRYEPTNKEGKGVPNLAQDSNKGSTSAVRKSYAQIASNLNEGDLAIKEWKGSHQRKKMKESNKNLKRGIYHFCDKNSIRNINKRYVAVFRMGGHIIDIICHGKGTQGTTGLDL